MKDSESKSDESVEQSDDHPPTVTVTSTPSTAAHSHPELQVCLCCGVVGLPERIRAHDCQSDRTTPTDDTHSETNETPESHRLTVELQFDDTLLNALTLLAVGQESLPQLQLRLSYSTGGSP